MRTWIRNAGTVVALCVSAWASSPAKADVKDYEFQLVQREMRYGDATIVVRLIDKRSGKAVPDAVIFATRMDMTPDEMSPMVSPVELLPSTEPGFYRFKTELTMIGRWQLSLAAKVQGETGTLQGRLVVTAQP